MNIRLCIIVFTALCSALSAGETWTLTNKKNQSIEIDYIFYDGDQLSCRKVGGINKFKISPNDLTKECWETIQKSMGDNAVLDLEVSRRTKTSTDTDRSSYSGYYSTYTHERKDTEKLNMFSLELTSSSHFSSKVIIETFIFAGNEVKYSQIPAEVSMRKPFEKVLEQMMKSTEYSSKSSYSGTYYKSEYGDDKASIGVIVLNGRGEEVAEFASSGKIKSRMHGLKHEKRQSYKPQNNASGEASKKKKGKTQSAQTI
ncbi:MAG: hypothetical protein ACPGES_08535 [Coraliomargarita sp.]